MIKKTTLKCDYALIFPAGNEAYSKDKNNIEGLTQMPTPHSGASFVMNARGCPRVVALLERCSKRI